MFDVIIVGGSNAGLSAALLLGRARRRVLVIDHEQPRNAPSHGVHTFLSRDGILPADLRRLGREQLRAYDGVELRFGEAVDAHRTQQGFAVVLHDGTQFQTRKLLLATGVEDVLPAIDGFAAFWGTSVFHCPYCHGWEVRDQPLALYGNGGIGMELAQLLRGWSHDLVLCTDGPAELTEGERQQLARHGIGVREEKILRLDGEHGTLQSINVSSG